MEKLRLAFMGTPEFAVPALQALIDSHFDVVAVYTQPVRTMPESIRRGVIRSHSSRRGRPSRLQPPPSPASRSSKRQWSRTPRRDADEDGVGPR